jgi:hypothetical protein
MAGGGKGLTMREVVLRGLRIDGPRPERDLCGAHGTCCSLGGGVYMHPLLVNAETDHRSRTPESSGTNRKLTALERQRVKGVAFSNSTDVKGSQSPTVSEAANVDEKVGLVQRIVH